MVSGCQPYIISNRSIFLPSLEASICVNDPYLVLVFPLQPFHTAPTAMAAFIGSYAECSFADSKPAYIEQGEISMLFTITQLQTLGLMQVTVLLNRDSHE